MADAPVFIVGAPRSGTTLVRSMLAAGAELSIPPESHFVGYLYRRYAGKLDRWTPRLSEQLARDIVGDAHFLDWDLDPRTTLTGVVAAQPASFAETIELVYRLYAEREGKTRWGDKTPHYLFAYKELRRLFPHLLLIDVVRDGRDVACSHLALSKRGIRWVARSTPAAAIWWRESISEGKRAAVELGQRYLRVRYEDVVGNPEKTLARLCEFVGIAYDASMVDYVSRVKIPRESPHAALFERTGAGLGPAARNWRSELRTREIRDFEAVAGETLDELGYEVACSGISPRERAVARARAQLFWRRRLALIDARHAAHRYVPVVMRANQRKHTRNWPRPDHATAA
jgi:hypothetical protein